jgi:O-antigen/teichoic acid export membrane protein
MKEFYTSVAISFTVRIAAALAAFLLTLAIARTLGPEQSGYYFLAFSVVAILAAFSRIGLDNTLVRIIGADTNRVTSVLKKALIMAGSASLACSILLFVYAEPLALHLFHKAELASVLKPISLGVTGLALLTLAGNTLQGLGRIVPSILVTGVILNFSLIAALLFIQPTTAASFAQIYALLSVATALTGFFLFLRPHLVSADAEIQFKSILQSCMPLLLVIIMQQLVQWSGLFVAGVYLEPESISLLACAQRTAMLVSFVLVAVNLVVAPRFALLYKQGALQELEKLALASVKLVTVLAFPVILAMVWFPGKIMVQSLLQAGLFCGYWL